MSYPLFGLIFIDLFSSSTWFPTDISWLGIPAIIAVLVSSHIFLLFLQTDRAARLFYLFKRGMPAAIYLDWLRIEESDQLQDTAIRLGLKRLQLSVVDELHLTIWGNLVFKSRALSGAIVADGKPVEVDDVFKVPLGVVSSEDQRKFIELAKTVRPDLVLNKRLEKKLAAKLVKGEDLIQALGAAFLLFVLFDLSHSLFGYLEMLKEYHLAQVAARSSVVAEVKPENDALEHFNSAEKMLESPPVISLVKRTLLKKGFATAAVYQARAEAQWYLGRKDDAIKSMQTALEFYPKSLRMHLELARWMAQNGHLREARKVLSDMADEHEDVLLPRLYMMVLFNQAGDKAKVKRYYEIYSDKLDLEVFGEEPWWPPGGNRYLNDSWSRDDVHFLLDSLLDNK